MIGDHGASSGVGVMAQWPCREGIYLPARGAATGQRAGAQAGMWNLREQGADSLALGGLSTLSEALPVLSRF